MTIHSATTPFDAAADATCAHCGLPVPPDLIVANERLQFCCAGCEAVHAAIVGCGLDAYYAMRATSETESAPATTSARDFGEFDDPAFHGVFCARAGEGLRSVELYLEGVHCAACVWLVERLPHLVDGVVETRLDFGRRIVRVTWAEDAATLSTIARRLASLGYTPHPLRDRAAHDARRAEDRRYLARLAVAGAIAGNVMLISFALYGGAFHGMEPAHRALFQWTSLGLTIVSLLWPGRVFFRSAIGALRARALHMDVPVAIGLAAGAAWSAAATIFQRGEVYFDSVTVLVFFLLAGRWVQTRQQRRSSDAVELLFGMTPRHARVIDADGAREVDIASLAPGQVVEVRSGESIPVDGTVVEGASDVDLALLNGESAPIAVRVGAAVHAGTTNITAPICVRVECAGAETRVGRLMHLVEESARRRAPIVRQADRLAGGFVAVVLALAAVTLAIWWTTDPARAVASAIALLIVTCPCALSLATPLAVVAAIGQAARRGVLIKGGETLERLTRHGTAFLDKTGTLTEGLLRVTSWDGDAALRPVIAAVERASSHPVARAIAAGDETSRAGVDDLVAGSAGVSAAVDGRRIVVGTRAHVVSTGAVVPRWCDERADAVLERGSSPVFAAVDGHVEAVIGVGDAIRPDAKEAIDGLRARGWTIEILSGDHPRVVRGVGATLGIDKARCRGGLSPESKLEIVRDAAARGPAIMVGDGVNDAAALAAATVGVAVRGGAEASLSAADVYLDRGGVAALPDLVDGAARSLRAIRRGLGVSLLYNVVGASLAMAGAISPVVAAILMPTSSLTVLALAFRAHTFEVRRCR